MTDRKTAEIKLRCTPTEKARWEEAAQGFDMTLSELIRTEMNNLADQVRTLGVLKTASAELGKSPYAAGVCTGPCGECECNRPRREDGSLEAPQSDDPAAIDFLDELEFTASADTMGVEPLEPTPVPWPTGSNLCRHGRHSFQFCPECHGTR